MSAEPDGCIWCGGNGRLETYTADGEVDESTDCVCVLHSQLVIREALLASRTRELAEVREQSQ